MAANLEVEGLGVAGSDEWPNDRGYKEIMGLHTQCDDLNQGEEALDFLAAVQDKRDLSIVDLGMGNGQFLIDLADKLSSSQCGVLLGVSASPEEIHHRECAQRNIQVIEGMLPSGPRVLELLRQRIGSVDFVFDTFGPATYSDNPVHSLIYSALLLKRDGKFSAITSTQGDKAGLTVFGDEQTRAKIIRFFNRELGIELYFNYTAIASRVNPGTISWDLLVAFSGSERRFSFDDYFSLLRKADQQIGVSQRCSSWYEYKGFSIDMRVYGPAVQAGHSRSSLFGVSSKSRGETLDNKRAFDSITMK